MITVSNLKTYTAMPFDEYLKLPCKSFTGLKRGEFAAPFSLSAKMEIGTLVDAFLTQPDQVNFNSPYYKTAFDIYKFIKNEFGSIIGSMVTQLSFTCELEAAGLSLPFKGRPDFTFDGLMNVDLKVTGSSHSNYKSIIDNFEYDSQQYGYAHPLGIDTAYLLVYSTKDKIIKLYPCDLQKGELFFMKKILLYGN